MEFRVQYIKLRRVPHIEGLDDIIRDSFKQDIFNDLSLNVSETEFETGYKSSSLVDFYDNLCADLYASRLLLTADMTIVFCNENFVRNEEGGDPEHISQIFDKCSISYMGYPGRFNLIPPLVNLETAKKTIDIQKGWGYKDLRGDLTLLTRHEYGHAMGCGHCEKPDCVMNKDASNNKSSVASFCETDIEIIRKSLEEYFSNHRKIPQIV